MSDEDVTTKNKPFKYRFWAILVVFLMLIMVGIACHRSSNRENRNLNLANQLSSSLPPLTIAALSFAEEYSWKGELTELQIRQILDDQPDRFKSFREIKVGMIVNDDGNIVVRIYTTDGTLLLEDSSKTPFIDNPYPPIE